MLVLAWILGIVNLFLWMYPAVFYPAVLCGLMFSVMAYDEYLVHRPREIIPIILNALALAISLGNLALGWILAVGPKL